MISLFTPSHNSKYLDAALESLVNQTYSDWEWVVLLNNGATWTCDDARVKLYESDSSALIGLLKNEAAALCTGEYLVEFDHDDLLSPNALEEIVKAFEENKNVGFVYSDFAQINEDGTPNLVEFDKTHGWEFYDDEHGYHVCKSLSHHPANLAYVWYAPNHVRAFRKSVYDDIGGYDVTMEVLDDQDIICRMYLASDFYHIPKNLYLQRVHTENSQAKADLNAKIQQETHNVYAKYIELMILKWATENDLECLDLGGAHNPAPGYVTVDLEAPADYIGDVFEILSSFDDGSVGVIRAVDFLEHIENKIELFNEMYRVLAEGGMILSFTPSTDGRGAFQDPTHVAFYNENSFWYFTSESHRKYVPAIKAKFQRSRLMTYFPNEWHRQVNISYVSANLIALKDPNNRYGGQLDF